MAAAASASGAGGSASIDEDLYSRQLYAIGAEAMQGLMRYTVLISGLKGPGVEAAKNTILAGPREVTLHDPDPCQIADMSSNFYITEDHVRDKTRRDVACGPSLQELNPYVAVKVLEGEDDSDAVAGIPAAAIKAHACVLAVNKPFAELAALNEACREHGTHLIATNSRGLFGSVFVDLGPKFQTLDKDGENARDGVVVDLGPAEALPEGQEDGATAERLVTADAAHRHGLEDGDLVSFELLEGECASALNGPDGRFRVRVVSSESFAVRLPAVASPSGASGSASGAYARGGHWQQHKLPVDVDFVPFGQMLGKEGAGSDKLVLNLTAFERPAQLHALSQVIDGSSLAGPAPTLADAEPLAARVKADFLPDTSEEDSAQLARLAAVSSGDLCPMAAVLGGVAGQEVVKAAGRKYTPLSQMVYLDAAEALPALPSAEERAPRGDRYDGQRAVFGQRAQERLGASRTFVVGSGALGCEFLKGFALMGVGCGGGGGGGVTVTDMDRIERSNLNRQFLFRPADVGQPKSVVAARAASAMNASLNVTAHELIVAPETADTFDAAFWSSHDFVTNALDNVKARQYVDGLCVEHGLALLESGTLGTKCNTMTVIPHKTLSYSSEDDQDEGDGGGIPVCTLKTFPYLIEHTLQWARDHFEAEFVIAPQEAQAFVEAGSPEAYVAELRRNTNEMVQRAKRAHSMLRDRSPTWDACVRWARVEFERLFVWPIRDLLKQHPEDKTADDGTRFWTAKKRPPVVESFSLDDEHHASFLVSAASLRARVCGVAARPTEEQVSRAALEGALASFAVPEWVPSSQKIATTDEEAKAQAEEEEQEAQGEQEASAGGRSLEDEAVAIVSDIPTTLPEGVEVGPDPFEKDDDSNGHVAFVASVGNIRARQYRIPTASTFKAKGIVGRIIPALATTTAMTTGFVCLELYKLIRPPEDAALPATSKGSPLPIEAFRNGNHNLAINQFTAFEPPPCPVKRWGKGGSVRADDDVGRAGEDNEDGVPYTLWSWITLRASEGVASVQDIVGWFEERDLEVDGVALLESNDKISLYNGFPDDDTALPFREMYEKLTGHALDKQTVKLLVMLESDDDDEDDDDDDEDDEDEGDKDDDADCPLVKLVLDA